MPYKVGLVLTVILFFITLALSTPAQGLRTSVKPIVVTPVSAALIDFEQKATRLNYLSETDAFVSSYAAPLAANVLTIEEFRRVNLTASSVPITEVDFEEWVGRQSNYDNRWLTMYNSLQGQLGDVHLYRVGNIQIQYYAVGLLGGRLIGIRTFSIET